MTFQYSPVSHGLPSLPQYLPPGCKFLSCHDARNVLRSCSTWRLPNGTLVAPLGGELYQVVEVPANCDERCSLHQSRSTASSSVALLSENSPLLRNEWLRFRHLSEHDNPPCYAEGVKRLPMFYTGKKFRLLSFTFKLSFQLNNFNSADRKNTVIRYCFEVQTCSNNLDIMVYSRCKYTITL